MAAFDICKLSQARRVNLVVVLQSDFFDGLDTRLVAPLVPQGAAEPISKLTPLILVDGAPYLARLELLATVPASAVGLVVGSAKAYSTEIKAALDFLMDGI